MAKVRNPKLVREWGSIRRHRCYLCGDRWCRPLRYNWLETDHIIGAAGRSDEPCNLIRLCRECHDRDRNGFGAMKLKLEHKLWLKRKHDPNEYDEERLKVLSARAELPEPEEPKVHWVEERR